MADSWEDEEFEVPAVPVVPAKNNWDDEEDEVEVGPVKAAGPTPAMVEAAAKKAKEEETALANQLKFAALEDETPDERRARERRQIEEADNDLTGELFDKNSKVGIPSKSSASTASSIVSGIAGTSLKSKDDHKQFGIVVAKKMADSTAFNIAAFYKSLTERVKDQLSAESLEEILSILQKLKDEKRKVAEPPKTSAAKKSKKQVEAEMKKLDDKFGGHSKHDKYADYDDCK
jgi:hypothetical protein